MRTAGQGPAGFEKRDGYMKEGQELVLAGLTGFEGTIQIAEERKAELEARFSPSFLRQLGAAQDYSVQSWLENKMTEPDCMVTAYEYVTEGGVLAALWNLSGIYCAGIDIDLRLLPVRQLTVEVCEQFELNPYRLLCSNCVIMAADRGNALVRELKNAGIPAAVIGYVTEGIARRIRHGEESAGFLERPQPDEIKRMQLLSQ